MAVKPERKITDLQGFELRVYQAVDKLGKATRREVGKLLRVRDDPHAHKSRSVLVRLVHEGLLQLHGKRRAAYYTVK